MSGAFESGAFESGAIEKLQRSVAKESSTFQHLIRRRCQRDCAATLFLFQSSRRKQSSRRHSQATLQR